jgi:uncharacterized protein YbjT (DUF2867 family)
MTKVMQRILVTGATGNVGMEVVKSLCTLNAQLDIVAGVRDIEEDKQKLLPYKVSLKKFDFTDSASYRPALENCQILFLLRPPQISDTEKYFKPLISTAKEVGILHIVFLSVQGVEKSSIIPHHKIEKLIVKSGIPYTFLRPAYFMQNFTTTLRKDLVEKKLIFLPAGNARFTLVDVRDVGEVAARIIVDREKHVNISHELTCTEKLTFKEMAEKLSSGLGTPIKYQSPNLLHFYLRKRKEKVPSMFILVMIMLHYLPRFQKEPSITNWVEKITGNPTRTFERFIADNKAGYQRDVLK